MDGKEWYRSTTIMSAIAGMIVTLLGAFKVHLPAEIQGQITDLLLAVGQVISGLLVIWGRIRAEQPIKSLGVLKGGGTGTSIVLMAAMSLSLTACETIKTVTPPAPKTPQQAVFLAEGQYGVALKVALSYESLPRCGGAVPKLCSDKVVVEKLRLSQLAARAALDAAESTVRNPVFGKSAMESAVLAATNAVTAFDKVQATLGVKP